MEFYSDIPEKINSQLEILLQKHRAALPYHYSTLDEQLIGWLRLALGLTEKNGLFELNYLAPSLMLYICGAVGGCPQNFWDSAAAVQCMHQASAILDDIQDQDSSNALTHKVGEAEALNLALILLHMGQATLYESLQKVEQKTGESCFDLVIKLSQNIATGIRGQLLDLQDKHLPLIQRLEQPQAYLNKIAMKTALTSSYLTELGATLGGANHNTIKVYQQFGFAFGLALHILDDLQDFVGGVAEPEKSQDVKHSYLSLAVIYAYQEFASHEDFPQIISAWGRSEINQPALQTLFLAKTAFVQTLGQALCYVAQAEQALKQLDRNLEKVEHQLLLGILKNFARSLQMGYVKSQSA